MLAYHLQSDIELFQLIQTDDTTAFNELYNRHVKDLFQYANKVLEDKDAVKDILQEVFIWIWTNRLKVKTISIKGYLLVGVKFKIANYIRDGKVRDSFYAKVERIHLAQEVYCDASLEVKELKEFISGFIDELPLKCKEVFQLSRVSQLSHKEIALKLGISEKTVENQITIALNKLRSQMSRNFIWTIFFF